MKQLETELTKLVRDVAIDVLAWNDVPEVLQFQSTRKEFKGDITLVTFPLSRYSKLGPEQTAQQLGEALLENVSIVSDFNVVKGFLNISIKDSYWVHFLENASEQKGNYGFGKAASRGKKMVEFSSPNTNKPLHLGHLRNIFLGDSISRIFKAAGHEVVKVQIINDRGIHICKSMLAWLKFGEGETPESSSTKGDHLVGKYYVIFDKKYKEEISSLVANGMDEEQAEKEAPLLLEAREMLRKWEAGDPEVTALWKKMNTWVYEGFDATYDHIGTSFDQLYYESDTYLIGKEKVLEHEDQNRFFRKEDASLWVNLEEEGLDPKLLLRADGTSVYMTQDIGTAIIREEQFHCDEYYYVVGNEQDYHFKLLKLILEKMGFDWAKGISHLSYGMVDLPSGKMKSREGTVVDADDIMNEMESTAAETAKELGKIEDLSEAEKNSLFRMIGLGALKYFILKVDPKKNMLFNPEESVDFNGNTGPFIQYTHARIKSILRKVDKVEGELDHDLELEEEDRNVIKSLSIFPQIIQEAAEQKSPAHLANFIYSFVKEFNHFYQNTTPLIKESNEARKMLRLLLCEISADVLDRGMGLLGIEVPEQM